MAKPFKEDKEMGETRKSIQDKKMEFEYFKKTQN